MLGQPSVKAVSAVSLVLPDRVEVAADQRPDVRAGFGDGTENLTATGLRFDIADPHLQRPLALRAAADERRIQGYHDRRRCCFRPDRSARTKRLADLQGMAAQGRMMLPASIGNICANTSAAVR